MHKRISPHGDYDHMGEAINLVNNFKVEKVIFNCGPYNDLEKELIKVLNKKKIKYYSCIIELNIDSNKLYFLQTKEYDNENDNSNVIYTELNGYKFMFMGDASTTTEHEILNDYNLPDIDVLKVGHHGSKTSSSKEFIDEINPKYSIISVGKNNRYGHPNKEVLDNLRDSKIYRTDLDGSIMFIIKNNKLRIETCSPRKEDDKMNQIKEYTEKIFEDIKHIDELGNEYWLARELQSILAYNQWRSINDLIVRAKSACKESKYNIDDHFALYRKMIRLAKGATRNVADYKLSRYACYLIVMNGNTKKEIIALAQTYFAIQTRMQERK